MIRLKEMSKQNFLPVINLKLSEEDRRMVAPNMYSLAEAYCDKKSIAKAIYSFDTLVGFIMYEYDKKNKKGHIARLMIATEYQDNGYGSKALSLVLKELQKQKGIKKVDISYRPDNEKARKCYEKLGFIETVDVDDGEVVAILEIDRGKYENY